MNADPNAATPDAAFADLRALEAKGDLLGAVDYARRAAAAFEKAGDGATAAKLRYREVLALARSGGFAAARTRYGELGLAASTETESRALGARLRKDAALATLGADRAKALHVAGAAYEALYEAADSPSQRSYLGVNAATLELLAGDRAAARRIAADILDLDPSDSYWGLATRAELMLILGRTQDAAEALAGAAAHGAARADMATTLKQLRLIVEAEGFDPVLLDPLRPPPVLHYTGHIIAAPGADGGRIRADREPVLKARIAAAFDELSPCAVYGSLAAGADILVVEEALRRGIEARVFLPFRREDFLSSSVRGSGADWEARFLACAATLGDRLELLADQPDIGDDLAYRLVSKRAMGEALLRAFHLGGDAVQLAVWDGRPSYGDAGAAADVRLWQGAGRRAHVVDVSDLGVAPKPAPPAPRRSDAQRPRREVTIIFGDVKGFSKLHDGQLPGFVAQVLERIAARFDGFRSTIVSINTWGDGLFAVMDDLAAAGDVALSLQEALDELSRDAEDKGLAPEKAVSIRIAIHHGAAHRLRDPITGQVNFFGRDVAKAARIEPVTAPGTVSATAEFAGALALEPGADIVADYIGRAESAKGYGEFQLYRLRRPGPGEAWELAS